MLPPDGNSTPRAHWSPQMPSKFNNCIPDFVLRLSYPVQICSDSVLLYAAK